MPESPGEWRALPAVAVGALYIAGVQRFVRENLVVFLGAGTGFAISDSLGLREFVLIALLILFMGVLVAVIYHRRFRYKVADHAVHVRQGLFEQKELKVRFERVQNIVLSQPFYLKPFGLTRLSLETPGAAQTEVSLPGIGTAEAHEIRDRVSGTVAIQTGAAGFNPEMGAQSADSTTRVEEAGDAVFEASAADLFRYGLTSNQIWILLAVVGAPLMNRVEHKASEWLERLNASGPLSRGEFAEAPLLLAILAGGLILGLAVVLMTLSGLLANVRFYGYRLRLENGRFKARFGLLDAREKTLQKTKLHSVELVQTAIGRLLDSWKAIGHQTGTGPSAQANSDDRRFLIPGIASGRLRQVAAALSGLELTELQWRGIDSRFRLHRWSRIALPLLLGALVVAVIAWSVMDSRVLFASLALVASSALVFWTTHLRWKRWGWMLEGTRMRIRSGLIGQSIIIFELARCQQLSIRTSAYQRAHGLATLVIRLPHGEQILPYLPRATLDALTNQILFEIESASSHAL
ncbi:MAG: PH domain-containing protein [Xanthomonadaceae bacterium]|nr:PH domain-containing protein [Xanthomonadaceae bacterium]